MLELTQRTKLIKNRADFIKFAENLAKYLEDHSGERSDPNIASYLQSIAAWTSDMDGYYQNHGEEPPTEPTWRTVGEILLAALFYE